MADKTISPEDRAALERMCKALVDDLCRQSQFSGDFVGGWETRGEGHVVLDGHIRLDEHAMRVALEALRGAPVGKIPEPEPPQENGPCDRRGCTGRYERVASALRRLVSALPSLQDRGELAERWSAVKPLSRRALLALPVVLPAAAVAATTAPVRAVPAARWVAPLTALGRYEWDDAGPTEVRAMTIRLDVDDRATPVVRSALEAMDRLVAARPSDRDLADTLGILPPDDAPAVMSDADLARTLGIEQPPEGEGEG